MKSIDKQVEKQRRYYERLGVKRSLRSTHNPGLYKVNPEIAHNRPKFEEELAELKGKTFDEQIKLKRQLLARYNNQIQAYIRSGRGHNDLFSYAVQWVYDIGDLDTYFQYTDIAMARDVRPVLRSNKTFEECLRYDILEWADQQHKQKQSCEPYLSRYMARIEDWSTIPEKLRSSFWYLKFYSDFRAKEDPEKLIEIGKTAFKVHNAQVKTVLKELFLEYYGKEAGKSEWKEFLNS